MGIKIKLNILALYIDSTYSCKLRIIKRCSLMVRTSVKQEFQTFLLFFGCNDDNELLASAVSK